MSTAATSGTGVGHAGVPARTGEGEGAIRTPDQRLRVFVSSTLAELAEERAAIRTAIEHLHLIPVMFELGARPHPPRDLYRAYLAQSHIFVGVYWQRYGWVAPGEEVSGLEDEYRLAANLPQLLYVKDATDREPRLETLLDRIRADDRTSYRPFSSAGELAGLVQDDLVVLLTERFERAAAPSTRSGARRRRRRSIPPVPLTPTIGRDADLDTIESLLVGERARLITITGHGGVGKSRLGLEVARRVAGAFPDGVHLVPLEPVGEATAVLRAIADRLELVGEGRRGLGELIASHLDDRRLLLLLDNFEHVSDAAADVAALLDCCSGVQVLATSRRPLRIRGEHEYPLTPLAVPGDDLAEAAHTSGVQLYLARARGVRPEFALTAENLPAVAELVRRLDGLPLAIELAAARTRLLSPAALLVRLEERLDILSSGAVDLPERQRTLRSTIDWSYRLLSPDEQRLLDRLGVFAGPATLEAVEAVCSDPHGPDVLELLSSLLEKNLLLSTVVEEEPRVQLLNTVRVYAAERLAERDDAPEVADRHADWFLARVRCLDLLQNPTAHRAFDDLVAEVDDIRRAMDRVVAQQDIARSAAFASATWTWFWLRGRLADVRPWFESAAELAALPEAGPSHRGVLLYTAGQLRQFMGDPLAAEAALLPALEAFESVGEELGIAGTQIALAAVDPDLGQVEAGYERSLAALAIGERYDQPILIGFATAMLGSLQLVRGDLEGAAAAHRRSAESARRTGFAILEAQALAQLASVEAFGGRDVPQAWRYLADSAAILRTTRTREILSYWLEFAAVALEWQHPDDALRATLAGDAIRAELGLVIWPPMRSFHDEFVDRLRQLAGGRSTALEDDARSQDPWALMDTLLGRYGPAEIVAGVRADER
jgi:predicted ATPase